MASLLDRVGRFIDDVLLLPDALREELELAEACFEAGRHDEAEERFLRVLSQRPTLARAWVGLGQAREAQGDVTGAREAAAEARELEPSDGHVALWAARLALCTGDVEPAAQAARDAVRQLVAEGGAPLAEAYAVRARAEWLRGRPDRAARELRKAIAARDKPELRVELLEALVAANRPGEARRATVGLDESKLEGGLAARVGEALLRAGAAGAAEAWLRRAADAGQESALVGLARIALDRAALDDAESLARRAVARSAGAPALALLGDVLARCSRRAEAADAYAAAAAAAGGDVQLLRAAVRAAPLDQPALLERHADALDRVAPRDPASAAARAWAGLARGDAHAARGLDPGSDEPRAPLARAALSIRESRPRDALAELDAFAALADRDATTDVERDAAEQLRKDALRALWRGPSGDVDLAAAIDAVARFATERELDGVERSATILRDELDRPLLLAILGEFNAGKSTLVNAFLGADVAPTGILPTTATLNILRNGAERRVRVVRRDGTTREGSHEELRALLADAAATSADGEAPDAVDHVEIFVPSETLERVWILDTPGTNAIDPAHEKLAKEAVRRADAALWLFDAGQAGKATESRMLKELLASGRVVVPVLNKVDRLAPDEVAEVERVLREQLPELGAPLSVAARTALRARVGGDEAALAQSGFPALLAHLEREVFERARPLKRAACARRLLAVLDGALATEEEAVRAHGARIEELAAVSGALATAAVECQEAVDDAVRALDGAQDQAFREAATEVLAFVRPRAHRFERHGSDPEDRAFLADVLATRLGAGLDGCEARLRARLRGALAPVSGPLRLSSEDLDARARSAIGPAVGAFRGYQRGLLAGGALHRFFEDVLPRARLEEDELAQGLAAARADAREELRPSLLEAASALVAGLESERAAAERDERRARESIATRVFAPLRALRTVLYELAS